MRASRAKLTTVQNPGIGEGATRSCRAERLLVAEEMFAGEIARSTKRMPTKKGRRLSNDQATASFLLNQTSGPIATVWSRWKKGACRTALRTATLSTRAYPKNWSSRRNYDREVWLLMPPRTRPAVMCKIVISLIGPRRPTASAESPAEQDITW